MHRELRAELVLDAKARLGEGPVWDAARDRLLFVDILAPALRTFRPDTGATTSVPVAQYLGVIRPRAGGGLVAGVADGFAALDEQTGELTLLAPVERDNPGNRMNDGGCDPAGRFYAGTMAMDEGVGQGGLYRLDRDHGLRTVLTGVSVSNGIAWSPDGTLMYYADTPTHRVDVFDYDVASGSAGGRRPFLDFTAEKGLPDGLTVDADGGLWIALHGAGTVRHYTAGAELATTVELPVRAVTACAFGGPGLGTLYVTTAADLEAGERSPLAGALFAVEPGVRGQPVVQYAG
ncbi:MAG TPA: SMP-30/gluconolactonase/LRE family protein [Pilimelia sp.]|nr:SMP-30/gluconolactonase/LRE family protein [Pilimelia sp.]